MKKFLFLVLCFFLISAFTLWSAGKREGEPETTEKVQTVQWNFSTGSMGGGFYAIGGGIADYVTKNVEEIFLTAVTSGGVNENITRLHTGDAEFGMLNNTDPPVAFAGAAPYTQKFDNMRGVGILYMQYVQVYTLEGTGIKTFLDLKGKNVCVGSPGGSMHKTLFDIVNIHGMDPEKDFKKSVYLPARDAMEALKMGQVDAVMEISTLPTPIISELALTHSVRLIEFAPGYRDKMVKEMPKYLLLTLQEGTYQKVGKVDTIGSAAMWGCNKDLPEDLVYKAVKAVYSAEGLKYLAQVHPAGSGVSLENAAKFRPIPLHPGAEKYYREAGVLK